MKRLVIAATAALLMVSLVSACASKSEEASATPAAPATSADMDMDMAMLDIALPEAGEATLSEDASVKVGEELMISLGSNPSTGYEWTVTAEPDSAILEKVADSMSPAESPMPGAPGTQTFSFRGVSAGSTTIELTYARPFGDEEPAQVVTVTVEVA